MAKEHSFFDYTRNWFNFCFDNPELVTPLHTAMYCWLVELNNRMGWAEKFSSPTSQSMQAIGIKSYNTHKKIFNDLVRFGFVKVIQESKNQFQCAIIALSRNNKALDKALDKALINQVTEHSTKHSKYNNTIDNRQHTIDNTNADASPEFIAFQNWIAKNAPTVGKMTKPFTEANYNKLIQEYDYEQIKNVILAMYNWKKLNGRVDAYLTFINFAKKVPKKNQPIQQQMVY